MKVSGEDKNVVIVHYNTPELTTAAIKSIQKHMPDCKITVLDNSDERPLGKIKGVKVLNNTKGKLINFDKLLADYPQSGQTSNKDGSAKHIASVDYLFDKFPNGFVLMDSDVLVRKDFSSFFNPDKAWVGSIEPANKFHVKRVQPYLLWINVPMCKEKGIRFWHDGMVDRVSHDGPPWYDTGASFYKDCNDAGLEGEEVYIYDYIEHFGRGSYKRGLAEAKIWLYLFRGLYE